jgi:hypothetical protein
MVNEWDSLVTQIPFEYYDLKLCPPSNNDRENTEENLGSFLLGESTQYSPYTVYCSFLLV